MHARDELLFGARGADGGRDIDADTRTRGLGAFDIVVDIGAERILRDDEPVRRGLALFVIKPDLVRLTIAAGAKGAEREILPPAFEQPGKVFGFVDQRAARQAVAQHEDGLAAIVHIVAEPLGVDMDIGPGIERAIAFEIAVAGIFGVAKRDVRLVAFLDRAAKTIFAVARLQLKRGGKPHRAFEREQREQRRGRDERRIGEPASPAGRGALRRPGQGRRRRRLGRQPVQIRAAAADCDAVVAVHRLPLLLPFALFPDRGVSPPRTGRCNPAPAVHPDLPCGAGSCRRPAVRSRCP